MPSFDQDTALEPVGAGRWRATVFEHWFVVGGPNGGFLAALMARAMTKTAGAGQPPRSLTLQFLRAPVAGEVEGQPEWDDTQMPPAPAPDQCEPIPPRPPGALPFLGNYEMRPALGPPLGVPAPPDQPARTAGWIRPVRARGLDPILIAALADAWLPAAHLRLPEPGFVPTLDLTIHWRAPLDPGAEEHPWVLVCFTARLAACGFWEEDGELWSPDGKLLAHSRQLATVRPPRR